MCCGKVKTFQVSISDSTEFSSSVASKLLCDTISPFIFNTFSHYILDYKLLLPHFPYLSTVSIRTISLEKSRRRVAAAARDMSPDILSLVSNSILTYHPRTTFTASMQSKRDCIFETCKRLSDVPIEWKVPMHAGSGMTSALYHGTVPPHPNCGA